MTDRRACLALIGGGLATLARPGRARARGREVVRVGSTLALPPFEFVDEAGEIRGFEIDLLRAIAERLNLEPEFVKTPFPQAFVGLAAGKYRRRARGTGERAPAPGAPHHLSPTDGAADPAQRLHG